MKLYKKASEVPNLLKRRNSICGMGGSGLETHYPTTESLFKLNPKSLDLEANTIGNLDQLAELEASDGGGEHGKISFTTPAFNSHKRTKSYSDSLSRYVHSKENVSKNRVSSNISSSNLQSPRRYSLDVNQIRDMKREMKQLQNEDFHLNFDRTINKREIPSFRTMKNLKVEDIEAQAIFQSCWGNLVKTYGLANLKLPTELTFLIGAPGAGKDTNSGYIKNCLGVDSKPIVVSSLLKSKECEEIKASGGLVDDKLVFELLLKEITKPDYTNIDLQSTGGHKKSLIIDGFPRSKKQAKLVELLFDKLCYIKRQINPNSDKMPVFRVSVLHVTEEESVRRQLGRGKHTIKLNEERKQKHLPPLDLRDTDIDPKASKKRYDLYIEQYDALKTLGDKFNLDEIDANGTKDDVKTKIENIYSKNLVI